MQYSRAVCLAIFWSAVFNKVYGHYGYVQTRCRILGSAEEVEYILSVIYNKIEYVRFNSTEHKAVGYNEFGQKWAEESNKNTILIAQAEYGVHSCQDVARIIVATDLTVKPKVVIQSEREADGDQKAVLVCRAYDFYPKFIKLTWMRNDKEVTADLTSTEEMADGDWFYQIHSHLEYFPKPGEKISCVVDHASSHRPMIYDWDPSLPESERSKIILGAVGLVMGIIIAAGGFIYYKRKDRVFARLPACLLPLETLNDTEQL